jgi:hypothetical protein
MEIRSGKKLAFKIAAFIYAALGIAYLALSTSETNPKGETIAKDTTNSKTGEIHETTIFPNIETGDIIFRLGTGFWSPFFASMNSITGFSHVGVAIVNENGSINVLHADADDFANNGGILETPINVFKKESKAFTVKKNNMPIETKNKFIKILLKMKQDSIGFDDGFTLDDNGQRVYCTEYLWIAARQAGEMHLGVKSLYAGRTVISVDSIYHAEILQ